MIVRSVVIAIAALAATGPTLAAPAKSSPPAKPARLVSVTAAPNAVVLNGADAEAGIVVTGVYSDGSLRDLTRTAAYRLARAGVVALTDDSGRRVLRPKSDGVTTLAVSAPGTMPVAVRVEVRNAAVERPISFRNDVVPALTKAGCSQGVCHGTPTGKGGFRLSLQGYNPEMDYEVIAHEGGARRVNRSDPGHSLLLLKPLAEVPHGGGKRLSAEMPEFRILSRWIAEGMRDDPPGAPALEKVELIPGRRTLNLPGAKQQIAAVARFSDGSVRDVTSLAKLTTSDEDTATVTREGVVEGLKRGDVAVLCRYQTAMVSLRLTLLQDVPGFRWTSPAPATYIDRHVFERLKLFKIPASALSSDSEFARRAYLDACGILPTAEEARAFLADPSPEKRSKLIAALTQRPEFAELWAVKWADVLRVQDETMGGEGAQVFYRWIRESLAANKPMDQFAREILTASGPTRQHPPANFYRAITGAEDLSTATAQLFLGVRMGCAKCHNHPFERWTQDEYYELAAFFAQVRQVDGRRSREATIELDPNGEETHLRTGKVVRTKLLGAAYVDVPKGRDRRTVLAEWMTRKDNPFFARAMVNRVWANLLGRGIVEPVDDFRDSNPPVNDALLDALAKDFVAHGFDLRYLVRTIMGSRTYQLSARPQPLNRHDDLYYSHALPRMLTAEQLADAISRVTGVPDQYEGYPKGTRAMQVAGTQARTPFLKTFGRPDRNLSCECEREKDPNLFQALTLITDREIDRKLNEGTGRIAVLAEAKKPDAEVLEELYLAAFSRLPTARERKEWLAYFARAGSRKQALQDLGWVLINSKEFLFRH
jgi:hypothetical protein